jgi:hypothetical protein
MYRKPHVVWFEVIDPPNAIGTLLLSHTMPYPIKDIAKQYSLQMPFFNSFLQQFAIWFTVWFKS